MWKIWLAAFTPPSGDEFDSVFSTNAKTKQAPLKSYVASFNTASAAFVDTGATISVPDQWYYAYIYKIQQSASNTEITQLLEGAAVKRTFTSTSPATILDDPYQVAPIVQQFQNTSGGAKTVKMQVKVSAGNVTVSKLSIISSPNPILYILPQYGGAGDVRAADIAIWAYCNTVDFVCASANTDFASFDSIHINYDNIATLVTCPVYRLVNSFKIRCNEDSQQKPMYIAYDWDGQEIKSP